MHWGLAASVGTEGPVWYRWHQRVPRGVGGVRDWQGGLGPSGGVRGALGAGREYRYSGASMGIGGIRALGGVGGHQGM